MRPRSILFWTHLVAGVGAGLIIFIMSATGVLLMYERQIIEWSERGHRSAPLAPGAARLAPEALLAKVVTDQPGPPPSSLALQSDPAAPAAVSFGRERTLLVDTTDGRVLGESAPKVRAFFRGVTAWHRWLGAQGDRRETGEALTGAGNLAFLVLVLSGLYLWLPPRWTRRQVRNVAWFRGGLSGKARDFNWHNVIGLWTWLPLLLIVLTGVVMSYQWANGLLFRLAGEEPPPARQEPSRQASQRGPSERGRPERGGSSERSGGAERSEGRPRRERGAPDEHAAPDFAGLDRLWQTAEQRVPGWRTITLRLPEEADAPVSFTILQSHRGRPDLRSQLTLDRQTGEVTKWEPFASQGPGRRLRAWARWVHTGEAGGFLGQTVAGIASLGAVVLVWTGFAMAWRRFFPAKNAKKTKAILSNRDAASPAREMP